MWRTTLVNTRYHCTGTVIFTRPRKGVFCGISPAERCANYTLEFFRIGAFRKIQIKSNSQLRVGLGLHLSLKSTSTHHITNDTVGKVIMQ